MCHKSCQQCLEAIALSSSAPRDDSSENVKNGLERDGRAAARSHEKWWPLFLLCFDSLPLTLFSSSGSCMCVCNGHTHTQAMGWSLHK